MRAKIHNLLQEDDAVSPVIGVILMVAITVILAAVIASFVLGLGGDSDVQPNTALSFDYSPTDEELTMTVSSGDSLDPNEVYIRGEVGNGTNIVSVNEDLANIASVVGLQGQDVDDLNDDGNISVTPTGGLEFTEGEDEGGVDEEISSGQGLVFAASPDDNEQVDSLAQSDFDIVWDTGDDSATLDGFEGPDA